MTGKKIINASKCKSKRKTSSAMRRDRLNGIGPPPPPVSRGLKYDVVRVTERWSGCGFSFRKSKPKSKKTAGINSWKTMVLLSLRADKALFIRRAFECLQKVELVIIPQLHNLIIKKAMKRQIVVNIKLKILPTAEQVLLKALLSTPQHNLEANRFTVAVWQVSEIKSSDLA